MADAVKKLYFRVTTPEHGRCRVRRMEHFYPDDIRGVMRDIVSQCELAVPECQKFELVEIDPKSLMGRLLVCSVTVCGGLIDINSVSHASDTVIMPSQRAIVETYLNYELAGSLRANGDPVESFTLNDDGTIVALPRM